MFTRHSILALAISGALLTGCDKDKTETTPPAGSVVAPAVPATPAMPTLPPVTTPAIPSVTTPTTDAATPVVPAVPSVTPPTTPAVPAPTAPGPSSTPDGVKPAVPTPAASSGDVNADAQATLSQFGKDMLAKDWKAAGADLKKLNDEKDKLSPEMKDALKKAQTELEAAKATSGLKIPGLGGDTNK